MIKQRNTLFGTTLENRDPELLIGNVYEKSVVDVNHGNNNQIYGDYEQFRDNLKCFDSEIKERKRKKHYFECLDNDVMNKWSRHMRDNGGNVESYKVKQKELYRNIRKQMKDNSSAGNKPDLNTQSDDYNYMPSHLELRRNMIESIKSRMPPTNIRLHKSGWEIPRNICHEFREDVCDNLLSNMSQVIKSDSASRKEAKKRVNIQDKVVSKSPVMLSEYERLGGILRMNVLPGYTVRSGDKLDGASSYKAHYQGWDTFQQLDQKMPNEFRLKKDELSKWADAAIVEARIYKDWDQKTKPNENK